MKQRVALGLVVALLVGFSLPACDEDPSEVDGDVDGDADGDLDGDSDGDGDGDAEGDGDADGDDDGAADPDGDTDRDGDADRDGARDADWDADPDRDSDGEGDSGVVLPPWPTGRYITAEDVRERHLAEAPEMLPLNVVDEEHHHMGHIEGSLVIPWDLLPGRLAEVDPARHVVIYCRLGVRSEAAHTTLDGAGYEHIWIMSGGITEWIALGYPTTP